EHGSGGSGADVGPDRLTGEPRRHPGARLPRDRHEGGSPAHGRVDAARRPRGLLRDQGGRLRRLDPPHIGHVRGPGADLAGQARCAGSVPVAVSLRARGGARRAALAAGRVDRRRARACAQMAGRALEARLPGAVAPRLRARRRRPPPCPARARRNDM
ncbi:MAG: hypothetical protein AVDCRST_MAG69-878, partial [uncultured Solirubrobacteraceae bacterium]